MLNSVNNKKNQIFIINFAQYFDKLTFTYLSFKPKPLRFITKQYNKVGMIAGGTGIAPIYHVL